MKDNERILEPVGVRSGEYSRALGYATVTSLRDRLSQAAQRPRSAAERVKKGKAANILGVPERTVIDMASKGRLPGAAKIGRCWTFDVKKLRDFIQQREEQACQESAKHLVAATGGTVRFGGAARSPTKSTDGLFTRTIQQLQKDAKKSIASFS
jgi:hypothetical protein